jgi:hypothetical protein
VQVRHRRVRKFGRLRTALCVLLFVSSGRDPSVFAQAPKRQGTASSCKAFVQQFYEWYSRPVKSKHGRPDRGRYDGDVLKDRPEVLDASLYRLLKADLDCRKRSKEICNLDFDPFYNSQDASEKYVVKEVHLVGHRCTVPMTEIVNGERQRMLRVQPELEWRTTHWVFVDFDYFYPDDPGVKPTNLRRVLTANPE